MVVGIVSPGAMGSAVGDALARGGTRVVATIAGRSRRTARLAEAAAIELLPGLPAVVRESAIVLSVVPPGEAPAVASTVAEIAARLGVRPLFVDLNAVAPQTVRALETGLDLVDGSISGPPPRTAGTTRIYLSGPRASDLAGVPMPGVELVVVGAEIGAASAVKMCTASVYKGQTAVLAHALLTARANGVLEHVLADLGELAAGKGTAVARSVTKAHRYVDEMREIAATQEAAGLPRELFDGMAAAYEALARRPLGSRAPEEIDPQLTIEAALDALDQR